MTARVSQRARMDKAAEDALRPWPRVSMPVKPNFPPLSPELQRRAEEEWKAL